MVQRNKLQALISYNTGGMSSFTYETASDLPSISAKLPFAQCDKDFAKLSQTTYLCSSILHFLCVYVCYYFFIFSVVLKGNNFFMPNQIFYFDFSSHFYNDNNLTLPSSL